MRYFSTIFLAPFIIPLVLATSVSAQSPAPYVIPSVPAPRDPLPRFTIAPRGAPLGPIGLTLPQIGLQPPVPIGQPPHAQRGRPYYQSPMLFFYMPQPLFAAELPEPPSKAVDARGSSATDVSPMSGKLVLDIVPAGAQVFVDGYYVGVPSDFGIERGGGVLEAGTHRLDVSAGGYEPVGVDIRVASGQIVTYRSTLKPLPPPAAVPPSTFYLIPGCYMGNIPPKDARLPDSCDKNRAITWRP